METNTTPSWANAVEKVSVRLSLQTRGNETLQAYVLLGGLRRQQWLDHAGGGR